MGLQYPNTTDGKHWSPVPDDALPEGTGGIFGVYLADDECVQWHFTYYQNGRRVVSGYTIHKRG